MIQTKSLSDRATEPSSADASECDTFRAHPDVVARLRHALIGGRDVETLAETFRILGDTTRVRMLDALSHAELCVCDLATLLDLSESAVSHQLRLLRGMRLVRPRRDGRMVFYTLDDQHIIRLLEQGLGHVGESPGHLEADDEGRNRRRPTTGLGTEARAPRTADDDTDRAGVLRGKAE